MTYTLRREQWIARPIDEVFAFFADAHNLEEITPPWLGFKILSMSTDSIEEGTSFTIACDCTAYPFTGGRKSASGILPIVSLTSRQTVHISNGVTRTGLRRTAAGQR